jgi:hypothetical protein
MGNFPQVKPTLTSNYKVYEKKGKLTRLVHVYWSKTSTKENMVLWELRVPSGNADSRYLLE